MLFGAAHEHKKAAAYTELLTTQDVRTQKQLLDLLEAHGMKCTQSTVSRDIRAWVVKQIGGRLRVVCCGSGAGSDSKGVEQMQYIAQMSALPLKRSAISIVVKD